MLPIPGDKLERIEKERKIGGEICWRVERLKSDNKSQNSLLTMVDCRSPGFQTGPRGYKFSVILMTRHLLSPQQGFKHASVLVGATLCCL